MEVDIAEMLPTEEIEQFTKGFLRKDNLLVIPGSHIRAHLKDCANVIKVFLKEKNLKAKLADRVYVLPDLIILRREGKSLSQSDGFHEHPVHAMTMHGPRSSLSRSEYVIKAELNCQLYVLDDGVITETILRTCLEYGKLHGFGADRSLGEGKYEFKLE